MAYIDPKRDYKDGEILYGIDLTASNEVIKAGVDDNFDRIQGLNASKQNVIDESNKLDYSLLDNTPDIPEKTSDLTNDSGFITDEYHDNSKQDILESGLNIKTINNESILGEGNLVVEGTGTTDYDELENQPKVNGITLVGDKSLNDLGIDIPTKMSELTNDNNTVTDASYVHTDSNYTAAEKTKLATVEAGAQANVTEVVVDDTPTADTQLVIDPYDISPSSAATEITNQTSSSTELAYSCAYTNDKLDTIDDELSKVVAAGNASSFLYGSNIAGEKVYFRTENSDNSAYQLFVVPDNLKFEKRDPISGNWSPVFDLNLKFKAAQVTTANTNLNDYNTAGFYNFTSSVAPSNCPSGTNGVLQVIRVENSQNVRQIWYRWGSHNTSDFDIYTRTYFGNSWSNWHKIMTNYDKEIITFGLSTNFNYSGNTETLVPINKEIEKCGVGNLTLDTTNNKIVIGDYATFNYILVSFYSELYTASPISGNGYVRMRVFKNNSVVNYASCLYSMALYRPNLVLTNFLIPVSPGDYITFKLYSNNANYSTIMESGQTHFTVEAVYAK